jgi:hypothetical protein
MGVKVEVGGGGISQSDADTRYVNVTGDETVAGAKTFSGSIVLNGTKVLGRAANVAAVTNGTNAQKVEVYNTTDSDTSPVNYERGLVGWSGNTLYFQSENGGTGTARNVAIRGNQVGIGVGSDILRIGGNTNSINGWNIDGSSIHLSPMPDITRDIGTLTQRVRTTHSGGYVAGIVSKTASYTATASDYTILCDSTSGAITITLPAAASHTGRIYFIRKTVASANAVTIDPNAAELVNGAATYPVADNTVVQIQCDGTNWHILSVS